jgi:hypothetical protein
MADEAANPGESTESATGPSGPQATSAPAQTLIDILEADEDGPGVAVSSFEHSDVGIELKHIGRRRLCNREC